MEANAEKCTKDTGPKGTQNQLEPASLDNVSQPAESDAVKRDPETGKAYYVPYEMSQAGIEKEQTTPTRRPRASIMRRFSKRRLPSGELKSEKDEFLELCSLELCPEWARPPHWSTEAYAARRSLRAWLQQEQAWSVAAAVANDPVAIRFPERWEASTLFGDDDCTSTVQTDFDVTIDLAPVVALHGRVTPVKVRCAENMTVGDLVKAACDQFGSSAGVHTAGPKDMAPHRCVFKVIGLAQFLLRPEWRLIDYEYVATARRKRTKISLELLKLDDEAMRALVPIRALAKRDVAALTAGSRAPRGDYKPMRENFKSSWSVFKRHERYLTTRLSALKHERERIWHDVETLLVGRDDAKVASRRTTDEDEPERDDTLRLSQCAEAVPLSATIRRFRMGAGTPYRDRVRVKLECFDAGGCEWCETRNRCKSLAPAKWSTPEELGPFAKWVPGECLELCADARKMPRSTRIVLTVYGDHDADDEVATVALPLFELGFDEPRVRRGERQLRLWPAEDVLMRYTYRSEQPGRQRRDNPARAMLGENPAEHFGVLTVIFDYPKSIERELIADDGPSLNDAIDAAAAHLVSDRAKQYPAKRFPQLDSLIFDCDPRDDSAELEDASSDVAVASRAQLGYNAAGSARSSDAETDTDSLDERRLSSDNQSQLTAGDEMARFRSRIAADSNSTAWQRRSTSKRLGIASVVASAKRGVAMVSRRRRPSKPSSTSDATLSDDEDRLSLPRSRNTTGVGGRTQRRMRRHSDSAFEVCYRKVTRKGRSSEAGSPRSSSLTTKRNGDSLEDDDSDDVRSPTVFCKSLDDVPQTRSQDELSSPTLQLQEVGSGGTTTERRLRRPSAQMRLLVERIVTRQPLERLSAEECDALWIEREYASRFPDLLPAWWLSVPRYDRARLGEARALVVRWARRDVTSTARRPFKPRQQLHRSMSGNTTAYTPSSEHSAHDWPSPTKRRHYKHRDKLPAVPKDPLSHHARVALELLDYRHTDLVMREYACRRLDEMRDDHLADVLLQLVQVLKLEARHDSPLARLLVRRAACSPLDIGFRLFWMLRSEMHAPGVCERFGVVLHALLSALGAEARDQLVAQITVDRVLGEVARKVKSDSLKTARSKARDLLKTADRELKRYYDERRQRLLERITREREELGHHSSADDGSPPPPPPPCSHGTSGSPPTSSSSAAGKKIFSSVFPSAFGHHTHHQTSQASLAISVGLATCLDPTLRCRGIEVSKCRVMSSKKRPLLVVLKNADPGGDELHVIYKHGDDLRQDQLTLQLVRLMDDLWRRQGLDLQMWPYRCVACGDSAGMIEVVREARTTADIQVEFGRGARGAFKDNVVSLYLLTHNFDSRSFERARATFVSTCSGYCVATHVLGVGDRHSDNIMVTTSGRLFHIDFGHFLGNFKDKFGIKRERSPFAFTPDMKNVMSVTPEPYEKQRKLLTQLLSSKSASALRGGHVDAASLDHSPAVQSLDYGDFENFCCDAYNALRDRAASFVVLFTLMLPAGMPELIEPDNITYMIDQLALDLSREKADKKFRADIKNAHRDIWRRVDNYFHNRHVYPTLIVEVSLACHDRAGNTRPRTTNAVVSASYCKDSCRCPRNVPHRYRRAPDSFSALQPFAATRSGCPAMAAVEPYTSVAPAFGL